MAKKKHPARRGLGEAAAIGGQLAEQKVEAIAEAGLGFNLGIQIGLEKTDKQILSIVKELLRKIRAAHKDPKLVRKMRSVCADADAK